MKESFPNTVFPTGGWAPTQLLAGQCSAGPPHQLRLEGPISSTFNISENGQIHAVNTFSLHIILFTSCMFQVTVRSLIKVIEERDPSLVLTKWKFWLIKYSSSRFAVSLEQQELVGLCSSPALWKFCITFMKGLCMMS